MGSIYRIWAWLAAFVVFSSVAVTYGQEVTVEEEMPATVSVRKIQQDPTAIAGPVTVIDSKKIQEIGAKTVVEALRHQTGVNTRDVMGNGRVAAVDVRGGGSTTMPWQAPNTLVLMNGRKINSAHTLGGVDWTEIPVNMVDRIEIYRGSNAVVHGDNAGYGTINIITKPGTDVTTAFGDMYVTSYGGYGLSLGVAGMVEGVNYNFVTGYNDLNGYRNNNIFRDRYATLTLGQEGEWFGWDLDLLAKRDEYDIGIPVPAGADREDFELAFPPFGGVWLRGETETGAIRFVPRFKLENGGEISLGLDYSESTSRFNIEGVPGITAFDVELETTEYGIAPQYAQSFMLADMQHDLVLGLEYHVDEVEETSLTETLEALGVIPPGAGEIVSGYRREIAFFIHDTVEIMDNVYLNAGYRRARVHHHYGTSFVPDDTFDVDAANLGLSWNYQPESKAFISLERAYRGPYLYDILGGFADALASGTANVDYEPQIIKQIQAGVKHKFNDTYTGSATAFYSESKDELLFFGYKYDETKRQGIELDLEANFTKSFSMAANYTYIDSEFVADNLIDAGLIGFDLDGEEIWGVPTHSGSISARYLPIDELAIDLRAKWVRDNKSIGEGTPFTASGNEDENYFVVDATASYTWNGLTVYAGVNNILNQEYSEVGIAGITAPLPLVGAIPGGISWPAPERNFFAGVKYVHEF